MGAGAGGSMPALGDDVQSGIRQGGAKLFVAASSLIDDKAIKTYVLSLALMILLGLFVGQAS